MNIRVLHVVGRLDIEASGPSYSVPRLCDSLCDVNVDVALHAMGRRPDGLSKPYPVEIHRKFSVLERLWISPGLKTSLCSQAHTADIIHNHGLWTFGNTYPATAVQGTNCLLMASPRGTLAPQALERRKWSKRIMWRMGQRHTLEKAACLHATSPEEYKHIRDQGFQQPITVIPNGVDIPPNTDVVPQHRERNRVLFLGRIHPHKGVDLLLQSWSRLESDFRDWDLHLVGPNSCRFSNHMRRVSDSLGLKRVRFDGPAFGKEKSTAYQNADLFVLPTRSENFGMSIAEALAHGVPVIVTHGAPWQGVERHECGWWIARDADALTDCMASAMSLSSEQRCAMGTRGRTWMQREYSWSTIGRHMRETYRWLLGEGAAPNCVQVN